MNYLFLIDPQQMNVRTGFYGCEVLSIEVLIHMM
jgi:hypothetical protein